MILIRKHCTSKIEKGLPKQSKYVKFISPVHINYVTKCLENLMPQKCQGFWIISSYPIWDVFLRWKNPKITFCISASPLSKNSKRLIKSWYSNLSALPKPPFPAGRWMNRGWTSPLKMCFFIVSLFLGGAKLLKKKLVNFSTKTLESRNSSNVFFLCCRGFRITNRRPHYQGDLFSILINWSTSPSLQETCSTQNSSIARAAQMQNHPYLFGLKTNKISIYVKKPSHLYARAISRNPFHFFQMFEAWAARGWVKTAGIRKNRGLFAQDHRGCGFWSLKCELNAGKRLQLAHPKIQFRIGHQFWKLLQDVQGKRKTQGKVGPTLFQKKCYEN